MNYISLIVFIVILENQIIILLSDVISIDLGSEYFKVKYFFINDIKLKYNKIIFKQIILGKSSQSKLSFSNG